MDETFGERLRRHRERKGLTVGQLALKAGLTEAAIRKMEYGDTRGKGFVNGLRIAEVLDVDPWELAFGRRSKKSASGDARALESRVKSLQEQVVLLIEIAKAGVAGMHLTEAQKRLLARLEKPQATDRTPN